MGNKASSAVAATPIQVNNSPRSFTVRGESQMEAINKLAETTTLYVGAGHLEFEGQEDKQVVSPRLRLAPNQVFPVHVTRDVNDSRVYYASVTVK